MATQRFTADLNRFARSIDTEFATVIKRASFNIYGGIIRKTPVNFGTAQAGWIIGVNSTPALGVSSTAKIESAKLDILDREPYSLVIIANAVPYIRFLEMGSSKKAPEGMVAITIAEEQNRITPS